MSDISKGENSFSNMFAPYSPEKKGDLLEYLKSCNENDVDNYFFGSNYFKNIIDLNVVSPNYTTVRVNNSPAPDSLYFVNDKFLLESRGEGQYNMSAIAAKEGVYKPEDVLENKGWSIYGLKFGN